MRLLALRLAPLLALLLAALWPAAQARAHALDPVFVSLSALPQDRWQVVWRVPQVGDRPMPVDLALPASCTPADAPPPAYDGRAFAAQWVVHCPDGIRGGRIEILGLSDTRTDALVRYETAPGRTDSRRLTPAEPGFDVPAPLGAAGVLATYGALGVSHILQGADHLLFVLLLLVLIRNGRTLIGAVTAFTVAHSITLGAATLGWFAVPAPPVEALVALSIMMLAAELMRPAGRGLRLTERYPWAVAFGFGLLHGLGFASALRDIGLPEGEVPLALLSFNLGVELGQLAFILAVVAMARLLGRVSPALVAGVTRRGGPGARIIGYAAGGLAGVWFVTRLAAF